MNVVIQWVKKVDNTNTTDNSKIKYTSGGGIFQFYFKGTRWQIFTVWESGGKFQLTIQKSTVHHLVTVFSQGWTRESGQGYIWGFNLVAWVLTLLGRKLPFRSIGDVHELFNINCKDEWLPENWNGIRLIVAPPTYGQSRAYSRALKEIYMRPRLYILPVSTCLYVCALYTVLALFSNLES